MKLVLMSHEDVLRFWDTVSVHLKKAMAHGQGESKLSDYMRKILNNDAQCWAVLEDARITGIGLTEFLQYATHKTLHIITFTGEDFEKQSKVFSTVEDFAKNSGCKAIEQWGRQGWAKVLPKYVPGFEQAYVVMRKEIE